MKMQPLLIALALAAGTAFAQAPNGTAKAPADVPGASAATQNAEPAAKVHKKKVAHRKSAKHHEQHASARHHHEHYAKARHHEEHVAALHHHNTHAMGAGPARPFTDLEASARQHRMDQAYADWQARRR